MTPRDRSVCIDLYRHQVLTVHQLTALHFPTARKARKRLLELIERGVLLRFRPQRNSGSAPFHYVLGELGARIVAGHFGLDAKRLITELEDEVWPLAHSARLPHLLETNEFFVAILTRCRDAAGFRLARWWSEKRCLREWRWEFGEPMIRPDSAGLLRGPAGEAGFLLEVDRGTERGPRLSQRLDGYTHYARDLRWSADLETSWSPALLLFHFPGAQREHLARSKLWSYDHLLVATSHRDLHRTDPLGTNWSPVLPAAQRLTLLELAALERRRRSQGAEACP